MNSDILHQENEKESSDSLEKEDNNPNNKDSSKRKKLYLKIFK